MLRKDATKPIDRVTFSVPWPVSLNNLYGCNGSKPYVTRKAKEYKAAVVRQIWLQTSGYFLRGQRLEIHIWLTPPDSRWRDIDNLQKILFDAIQESRIIDNDRFFRRLIVEFTDEIVAGGKVDVLIKTMEINQ